MKMVIYYMIAYILRIYHNVSYYGHCNTIQKYALLFTTLTSTVTLTNMGKIGL